MSSRVEHIVQSELLACSFHPSHPCLTFTQILLSQLDPFPFFILFSPLFSQHLHLLSFVVLPLQLCLVCCFTLLILLKLIALMFI